MDVVNVLLSEIMTELCSWKRDLSSTDPFCSAPVLFEEGAKSVDNQNLGVQLASLGKISGGCVDGQAHP